MKSFEAEEDYFFTKEELRKEFSVTEEDSQILEKLLI
jgi:hypothetical protein